ncbi:MAG: heavy metal translocating P-type ATPase [Anaerolineae bacterium]
MSDVSCADELADTLKEEPAVVAAHYDAAAATLDIDYDANHLPAERAQKLARAVWQRMRARQTDSCGNQPNCEECTVSLQVAAATPSGYTIAQQGPRPGHIEHVTVGETHLPAWVVTIRDWLSTEHIEAILVGVTFITMIGGLLSENLLEAPTLTMVLFALSYAAGGYFGLRAGLETLMELKLDVDLLMVLAAVGAWIVGAPFEGALLLFLFSLSNVLQNYALDRTRTAIQSLVKLRPTEALVERDGETRTMHIEDVRVGDVIIVRPGDRIPMDGTVIEGETTVDQSAITGESVPVSKTVDQEVLAGTINKDGGIKVRVDRRAADSTLSRVIKLVEEARTEKAETQSFLDTFEEYYAWFVIALTVAVIAVPVYFFGEGFDAAFYRGMTVLVAASPCALIISTPAVILSAIGNGARRGILFKGGIYVEKAAGIKVVAIDKTGTLTYGKVHVTDIVPVDGVKREDMLVAAAAGESRSEHPLAQAIVQAAKQAGMQIPEATGFQSEAGRGVRATVGDRQVHIGSPRYFAQFAEHPLNETLHALQSEGKTVVMVAETRDGVTLELMGLIALADQLRDDVANILDAIRAQGVEQIVMLTGDNERVAHAIAEQAGVDAYFADLLPEDKVTRLKALREQYGTVAMVGDGVNDAPALAAADLGIAMGAAGTDVALETADVVLMADDLNKVPYVAALSRRTRRKLVVNLGFALTMIALMIGAIFFFELPLPLAVIGHEGGTVLVSLNGLTLLAFNYQRSS